MNPLKAEHPQVRCLEHGTSSLTLKECLSVLLAENSVRNHEGELSERILELPGEGLPNQEQEQAFFTAMETLGGPPLQHIAGMTALRRARLLAAFELARRYASFRAASPNAGHPESRELPALAQKALKNVPTSLRLAPLEWIGFVAVHRSGRLGELCLVSQGTRTFVSIDPAELFARLLALRPRAFFLFHNHPSGDPRPSAHDFELTRRVDQLSRELNVILLGHWIVTGQREFWIQRR